MQPQASRKVYVWSTLLSFKSETCVIYFEKISVCLYKITNILILGSKLGHWKIKYPPPKKKVADNKLFTHNIIEATTLSFGTLKVHYW